MKAAYTTVFLLFAFVVLAAASSAAQNPGIHGEAFSVTMHINGSELSFVVSDTDLNDSPDWFDPQSSPPPMSIADAIRIAKADLGRYAEHPDEWTVSDIAIQRFQQHPRWFYLVKWQRNNNSAGDGIDIPVLMSGRAVTGNMKRDADQRPGTSR